MLEKKLILFWGFIYRQSTCFRDSGNVAAFISFLSTAMTEQSKQATQATGKENVGTLGSIAVLIVYFFPFFLCKCYASDLWPHLAKLLSSRLFCQGNRNLLVTFSCHGVVRAFWTFENQTAESLGGLNGSHMNQKLSHFFGLFFPIPLLAIL